MNEAAHTISLMSPLKSWKSSSSFNTSNSDPTSFILNERWNSFCEWRVEWNETVWTCRDPCNTKKFSNLSPEILVEWIAPIDSKFDDWSLPGLYSGIYSIEVLGLFLHNSHMAC